MSEQKRLVLLILIMTCVSLLVGGIAGSVLFRAAIDQSRERLIETAQSQAKLIEAVARFDAAHSTDFPEGSEAATLSQITDAHEQYKGFGETGEFTLAKREGEQIVFLLSHRHDDLQDPRPVPFDSELAEPMRQALLGQSGTLIGLDYRGELVLAAHEPVEALNLGLGIVAKIDLKEVRSPFVTATIIALIASVLVVGLGSVFFLRISNPMVAQLYEEKARIEAILDTVTEAIVTINGNGIIESFNPSAERMFGYTADDAIGQNVKILMPPLYRDKHDSHLANYLKTGDTEIIGVSREMIGRRKDGTTFPLELTVGEIDHLRLFTGVMRDISQSKELQRDVLEIADEEQRRIGQDLHDDAGQELTALGLMVESLTEEVDGNQRAVKLAGHITSGLKRVLGQIRALARGLIPVVVDAEGLMSSLSELAKKISQLHGITCSFECRKPVHVEDNQQATHLFRITQEAVTNSIKHGHAQRIQIGLDEDDRLLTLRVLDDGSGIQTTETQNDGLGLRIMNYRAGLIGAKLNVEPAEEGGTLVTCAVVKTAT